MPSSADFWIDSLPGLENSQLSLHGGLLPASYVTSESNLETNESDAELYFLLVGARHVPNKPRLLLWLNGGPGCSSFDGAMIEIGPFRVDRSGNLRELGSSGAAWNEYANVLFLDQPAGTGFSSVTKGDDVRELTQAADQVVIFLANLFEIFPELARMELYIAGESYAGQWIPYIADAILKTTLIQPKLSGLMIGNGWIDPRVQYPAYLDYLVKEKLLKVGSKGHKIVKTSVDLCLAEMDRMDKEQKGIKDSMGMVLIPKCEEILEAITQATKKDGLCLNQYDTREYHQCGSEWPSELSRVTPFLRRPEVINSLHASNKTIWSQCSASVGNKFWTPKSLPSVSLLNALLEKMPILIYVGDRDLMCAYTGLEAMIDKLEWNGRIGMNGSVPQEYFIDSQLVGEWTTARNLTYVKLFNSSHMVPRDLPTAAHDMILRFLEIDSLHAAGKTALIVSQLGNEIPAILGSTLPNGTTLQESVEAKIAKIIPLTKEESERNHEREFGFRRSILLFVTVTFVALSAWAFFRMRRNRVQYGKVRKSKSRRNGKGIRLDDSNALVDAARRAEEKKHQEAIFDLGEEELDESSEDDGDIGTARR